MKNIYIILTVFALSLVSCNSLDLYPLDQGSSETWYSNETEYEMAVNDLYRTAFWPVAKEACLTTTFIVMLPVLTLLMER